MASLKITKRGRRLIYLGLIAYIVFLFISLPASFLTRYVLPGVQLSRAITLQNVHGSVWEGEAIEARVKQFNLGRLSWQLNGWALLLGDIDLDLKFNNQKSQGSGDVSISLGGDVSASNVALKFPAETLAPLFYGYPISISGELLGNVESLIFVSGQQLTIEGRTIWQSASLRAPQNIELGDFLVTMEPQNKGTKIKISDQQQGPIIANITLLIKGNGDYRLNGWLQARDQRQQHITEALRVIGRADNSGKYWIGRNGKIKALAKK